MYCGLLINNCVLFPQTPKEFHLFLIIILINAVNVIVMTAWTIVDPSKPEQNSVDHLVNTDIFICWFGILFHVVHFVAQWCKPPPNACMHIIY